MSEPFELYRKNLKDLTQLVEITFNQFDDYDGVEFKVSKDGWVKNGTFNDWIILENGDVGDSIKRKFAVDKRIVVKKYLREAYEFALEKIREYLYAVHGTEEKLSYISLCKTELEILQKKHLVKYNLFDEEISHHFKIVHDELNALEKGIALVKSNQNATTHTLNWTGQLNQLVQVFHYLHHNPISNNKKSFFGEKATNPEVTAFIVHNFEWKGEKITESTVKKWIDDKDCVKLPDNESLKFVDIENAIKEIKNTD